MTANPWTAIPCAIVRGGTSKGIFLLDDHLPADEGLRDRLLLQLMGSPDPRQIDGLGGADPLTSKVAIISRSGREGVDVEYESIEIGIADARVNRGLMCGNLVAGVGHFAIAEGLIAPQVPFTSINIYCRSNRKTIVARVPVAAAQLPEMAGREDAPVGLVFCNPGGALTGRLLPVGEPVSRLALDDGREFDVSIVDAGTLYAFVDAEALGMSGHESAATLDGEAGMRSTVELLRQKVADHINRSSAARGAAPLDARLVKMALIGRPGARGDEVDIVARVINTAKVHKAYAVSGGICLAAASVIDGTLVNRIVGDRGSPLTVKIGHPSGSLSLLVDWSSSSSGAIIHAAEVERSARIILRGTAYVAPRPAVHRAEAAPEVQVAVAS